jgi:hypothetical protein
MSGEVGEATVWLFFVRVEVDGQGSIGTGGLGDWETGGKL